jgi:hypothetical protein
MAHAEPWWIVDLLAGLISGLAGDSVHTPCGVTSAGQEAPSATRLLDAVPSGACLACVDGNDGLRCWESISGGDCSRVGNG